MTTKTDGFNDDHFRLIRDFVSTRTGIRLTDAKKDMVYGRLAKRVRQRHSGRFDGFCRALASDEDDTREFLINAITTNLTAFFRESHHFDYLTDSVIPALLVRNVRSRRLRFWSAGCSTGEEAYSLAMTVISAIPDPDRWDLRILATDLDTNAVDRAREGIYALNRIDGIPVAHRRRWLMRGTGARQGWVRVRPDLKQWVTFKRLNLIREWPMRGPFDVIFCRNVMIYFDRQTQQTLFSRFAPLLAPHGYLFVGHSEATNTIGDRFVPMGRTVYQKVVS